MLLLLLGGAAPTTQDLADAAKWLSRAADEAGHLDSEIVRSDDEISILEVRAQIDTLKDYPQTIQAFRRAFNVREKAYFDRDQAADGSDAARHQPFQPSDDSAYLECFYFCELAEIYADRGMTTAWHDTLVVANRWYDRIPKDDPHGNRVSELRDIAEVQALGGDLRSAEETLDRVQPEVVRIPMLDRIASELDERELHSQAAELADRGLAICQRAGNDPDLFSVKTHFLFLLSRFDELRQLVETDKSAVGINFRVRTLVQIAIREAKQGDAAKSKADLQAALSLPIDPKYRQNTYDHLAHLFAKSGDRAHAMDCMNRMHDWIVQSPATRPSDLVSNSGDYYSLQCCKIEVSLALGDMSGAKMAFDSTPKFAYPELESGYLNQIALLQLDRGDLGAAKATIARFKEAGHGGFCENAAAILVANGQADRLEPWLNSITDPDDRVSFCRGVVDGLIGSRPPDYESQDWIEPHHNKSLP